MPVLSPRRSGSTGKTTLVEMLLARAGVVSSPGGVERGTTVCDFDPLEKKTGHSLQAALAHASHRSVRVALIEPPGTPISPATPWPHCKRWTPWPWWWTRKPASTRTRCA